MPFTAEQHKEYRKLPHAKEARRKYALSEKGRSRAAKYRQSAKGAVVAKRQAIKRTLAAREIIEQAKDRPCTDCGGKFPICCMDLHHVRGVKLFEVGRGRRRTAGMVALEVEKCVAICANCHRIRHQHDVYKAVQKQQLGAGT